MIAGNHFKTILCSDLVDSTGLTERLGDQQWAELSAHHDRLARRLFAMHQGVEIDKTDGFLVLFDEPSQAVRAALDYQRLLWQDSTLAEAGFEARVGIHHAEVILRENPPEEVANGAKPLDVEGIAKPTAARIMALAGPSQILLGRAAFDRARNTFPPPPQETPHLLQWLAHGSYELKGVTEPIEIHEVGEPQIAPLLAPRDTDKVRRAIAPGEAELLGWRPAPGGTIPTREGWILVARLGAGAYGEVWLAESHESGAQHVFKFCFDAERLRGLKREVTVVRLLKEALGDRDDIARVIHWQFDLPPFHIESEYTNGGDLAVWSQRQGGIQTVDLETRLELLAQTATALNAAHSVGVLHKDIKPSNILIQVDQNSQPRARLADFGIGLIADRTRLDEVGLTAAGFTNEMSAANAGSSHSGTHLYMAPEILEGRAPTIQGDIYSLGVTLYQLVVGDLHRALTSDWRDEVADPILREDIERCVAGDPARRFSSALDLATRLRQLTQRREEHRATRQREAQEEAARLALTRARRIRRLSIASVTGAAIFIAIVGALWLRSESQRRLAESQRSLAVATIERNDQLILFMLGDLKGRLEPIGRLDIMDAVVAKLDEQLQPLPGFEPTNAQLAAQVAILRSIAELQFQRGDYPTGVETARAAIARAEELARRDDSNPRHRGLVANSHISLARLAVSNAEPEIARSSLATAERILEALHHSNPDHPQWLIDLSDVKRRIGDLHRQDRRTEDARRVYTAAVDLSRRLSLQDPSQAAWTRNLGFSIRRLAELEADGQRHAEALSLYLSLLPSAVGLVDADPSNGWWKWELAILQSMISECQEKLGLIPESFDTLLNAEPILHELAAADPENFPFRRTQVQLQGRLGMLAAQMQRTDEARRYMETALRLVPDVPFVNRQVPASWERELDEIRAALRSLQTVASTD